MSLLIEAHVWTHSEDAIIHPNDIGAFKLHDKSGGFAGASVHQSIKEAYASSRGIRSRLDNKRRSRHRDAFKQLEELLDSQKVAYQNWHHLNLLLLVFESGTLVTLAVNLQTGNIDRILVDKSQLGRIGSDRVVSAALTDQLLLLTHPENRLTAVSLQRPVDWKQWGRLSALEPRVTVWELPGPPTRRAERRLTLPPATGRLHQEVAVWWSVAVGEMQPWTPSGHEHDRANVLVYAVRPAIPPAANGSGAHTHMPPAGAHLELVSYCKTHHDPVLVQFSQLRADTLYTVEQALTKTGEVLVEHATYDYSSSVCLQLSAVTIPLTSEVVCAALSPDERRLLLGCADNSLVLHNCARKMTHVCKIQLTPCRVAWHPHSTVMFVTSDTGQLQCYDLALSQLTLLLLGDTHRLAAAPHQPQVGIALGQYFRFKPRVSSLLSCPEVMSQEGHVLQSLLITFERGPLALLRLQVSRPNKGRLHPSDVICDYASGGRLDAAINLLASLNWEQQGDEALAGLHMIVNRLLKRPLTPATEAQLEAALGSFLAPVSQLSEPVRNMYGHRVRNVCRRFFHHLLRHRCFEKAYRLALDLRDHDLFCDLHEAALRADQRHLAAAALARADQADNSSTGSDDDSSCSSDCSSSWHSDDSRPHSGAEPAESERRASADTAGGRQGDQPPELPPKPACWLPRAEAAAEPAPQGGSYAPSRPVEPPCWQQGTLPSGDGTGRGLPPELAPWWRLARPAELDSDPSADLAAHLRIDGPPPSMRRPAAAAGEAVSTPLWSPHSPRPGPWTDGGAHTSRPDPAGASEPGGRGRPPARHTGTPPVGPRRPLPLPRTLPPVSEVATTDDAALVVHFV